MGHNFSADDSEDKEIGEMPGRDFPKCPSENNELPKRGHKQANEVNLGQEEDS